MTNNSGGRLAALLGFLVLAACGGGSGGDSGTGTTSNSGVTTASTAQVDLRAPNYDKAADAARLAKQATMGPTADVVARIQQVGVDGWLTEQFAATGSSYADLAVPVRFDSCSDNPCSRRSFTREQVAMRFYADALNKPDQLRQRVALALSEIVIASTSEVRSSAGLAGFQQILLSNAFGNYRDILKAVTLNGFMGQYLNMTGSTKATPSENYARELLQLFSMGPDRLNMDGSPVTDASGAVVANYTPDDIKGVARALTGWTLARQNGAAASDYNARDDSVAMIMVPGAYDSAAKSFLGATVAAGASQDASVDAVVEAAFGNASTAPYISRALIQHLVTSNPSKAYVGRVAAVFANNGSNVRGDLKAVVRAILTDAEARGESSAADTQGKVKEPILLITSIARAIGLTGDGFVMTVRDQALAQPVFQSPSVFNFYPPDFPLPKSAGLKSPVHKLLTTGQTIARHNFAWDWTIGAANARGEFGADAAVTGATGSVIDWSAWEAFDGDVDGMIARMDLILLAKTMTAAQKTALKTAAMALTNASPTQQARVRAQVMLYTIFSSPLFQVDR